MQKNRQVGFFLIAVGVALVSVVFAAATGMFYSHTARGHEEIPSAQYEQLRTLSMESCSGRQYLVNRLKESGVIENWQYREIHQHLRELADAEKTAAIKHSILGEPEARATCEG